MVQHHVAPAEQLRKLAQVPCRQQVHVLAHQQHDGVQRGAYLLVGHHRGFDTIQQLLDLVQYGLVGGLQGGTIGVVEPNCWVVVRASLTLALDLEEGAETVLAELFGVLGEENAEILFRDLFKFCFKSMSGLSYPLLIKIWSPAWMGL